MTAAARSEIAVALEQGLARVEAALDLPVSDVDLTVMVDGEIIVERSAADDLPAVMRVYCAGKPALGLLCARLESQGLLGSDELVDDVVAAGPDFGEATVWDLLSHRAGVPAGRTSELSILPRARREDAVRSIAPLPPPFPVVYDELVGWEIVRMVIEERCGAPLDIVLSELLPWTVEVGLTCGGVATRWHRLHLGRRVIPLVGEVTLTAPWDRNGAIGWTASTTALARLGSELLRADRDGWGYGNRARAGGATWDPSLERWCRMGGGLMCGLADHSFGTSWSDRSVGHGGFFGATWFGADPDRGLVVAAHHREVIHASRAVLARRPAVMAAVDAALAKETG